MKIKNKYILILMGLALQGCSDFLEEYSQDKYLVTSYKDLDELLIGDCYMPVEVGKYTANARNVGHFIHFMADEIEEQNKGYDSGSWYDDNVDKRNLKDPIYGYYTWQKRVGQNENNTGFFTENYTWNETYRVINVANNIIENAAKVPAVTDEEKLGATRVRGEASFLRAAYYFWLANLYGKPYVPSQASTDLGVPVKTEAKVNDIIYQRNTLQQVYAQVLADLDVAEDCLRPIHKARSIYRADAATVFLLKSRVHLYMQNWTEAAAYADSVLKLRPELIDLNRHDAHKGFLTKESPEVIFSMGGNDVPCNMDYKFQSFRVSKGLYDLYDDQDLRKSQWWWTFDDFIGYAKIPYSTKYAEKDPSDYEYYNRGYCYGWLDVQSPVSDKFLYRTAEAYLNKAEAEAYMGHDDAARNALNTLRAHRYATGTVSAVTVSGQQLVEAIRSERQKELALEGHRWFDLRRYSVCEKYPASHDIVHEYTYYTAFDSKTIVNTKVFTLKANDPAYVLPIPQEVIEYNTGIVNNERPDRNYTIKNE